MQVATVTITVEEPEFVDTSDSIFIEAIQKLIAGRYTVDITDLKTTNV